MSLMINNARAHFDDFTGQNISLDMKGAEAKTDWKGQADNFIIRSVKRIDNDGASDGSVDASAFTVKKMIINSQGFLTIVSGPTTEIQADLSDDSRLFYTGKTKITGARAGQPIVSYQKIKETEYRAVEENYNGDSEIINDGNSNLIAGDNGKYFRLDRGQLSEKLFKSMSADFKQWLE